MPNGIKKARVPLVPSPSWPEGNSGIEQLYIMCGKQRKGVWLSSFEHFILSCILAYETAPLTLKKGGSFLIPWNAFAEVSLNIWGDSKSSQMDNEYKPSQVEDGYVGAAGNSSL